MKNTGKNPFKAFQIWFMAATKAAPFLPEAFALATASKNNKPSVRILLMKGFDKNGLVFYTNETSRKGRDISENDNAAIVFWWQKLKRQVRMEGKVKKLPPKTADIYFASRPRESQIGAWASAQSKIIPNKKWIEDRIKFFELKFKSKPVPRPPYWHGYRLIPRHFEFWQERPFRLHDRIVYGLSRGKWSVRRLAP